MRDHHWLAAGLHDLQRLPCIRITGSAPPGPDPGGTVEQSPIWIRAVWFIFVGWWAGAIYMGIAWFLCVIIITLPVGLWLFNRVGAVMTLLRY